MEKTKLVVRDHHEPGRTFFETTDLITSLARWRKKKHCADVFFKHARAVLADVAGGIWCMACRVQELDLPSRIKSAFNSSPVDPDGSPCSDRLRPTALSLGAEEDTPRIIS